MKHLEYRYTLGDKSWTLDFATLTVDDYIALKRFTGYNVGQVAAGHDGYDPLVLKGVLWLARTKSGEDIAWDDPAMSFTMTDLQIAVLRDDFKKEPAPKGTGRAGAGPGPTRAPTAPRTRTSKSK